MYQYNGSIYFDCFLCICLESNQIKDIWLHTKTTKQMLSNIQTHKQMQKIQRGRLATQSP